MKQKAYISKKSIYLSIEVLYKEKDKRTCLFTGGGKYPIQRRGKFVTSDPVMQEALESHPLYGKEFKLDHEEEIKKNNDRNKQLSEENGKLKKEIEELRKKKNETKKLEEEKEKVFKEVSGVSNPQDARSYLNKNFKVALNKLPNERAIKNAAVKAGVKFVDWK